MVIKVFIDGLNAKITLNEETHIYSTIIKSNFDGSETEISKGRNQISTTSLIGKFQKYSFEEPKWGMYLAIAKKYFPGENGVVARAVKLMRDAMKEHLDWRSSRGTALHLKAEMGQLPRIEELISKIIGTNPEDWRRINEAKFYVAAESDFDMPGTIDVLLINSKTKEVVLIDYKFSNANKRSYLDKQLNIYMSVLKRIGLQCKGLYGLTIHDNETIEVSRIENREYDLETIFTTINYFEK